MCITFLAAQSRPTEQQMRQQMAPPHDAFDLRAASGPTAADGRSKSVSNLQQPDPARAYPPHSGADTLPRGAQRHPGAAHLSQPDLRRDPTGPPGDYENYPRNNMAPQQQPDYVNQRDLRAQGSQSMHNLRGKNEQPMMQGAPRNDMRPTGPQGLPPGQAGAYHSLQRALDPQSTLRGQKLNPRASQEVRMGAPASPQQPPNMPQQFAPPHSQHGYPAPGFPGMQGAPRPMQAPPNATYQNFPVSSSAQNRFALPHQMGDPRMRANSSPDFPPPPDINPPLPEVPPPDDARNDSLPPPPPSDHTLPRNATAFNQYDSHAPGSAGLAYGQQNYQNLPPVSRHADMMYSQAPSHSGPQGGGTLNRNQSQSAGTLPRAPGAPSGQPIRPPAPATQAGKRPPPIAAKPKLNLAEIRKGFTQSPWEREEKEREVRRREEEKRLMRDHEISELERREHLSHEEQERLRRCAMCTLDNSNIYGVVLTVDVIQCLCSPGCSWIASLTSASPRSTRGPETTTTMTRSRRAHASRCCVTCRKTWSGSACRRMKTGNAASLRARRQKSENDKRGTSQLSIVSACHISRSGLHARIVCSGSNADCSRSRTSGKRRRCDNRSCSNSARWSARRLLANRGCVNTTRNTLPYIQYM